MSKDRKKLLGQKVPQFLKSHKFIISLSIIAAVSLFSYGPTLRMYFWEDDYSLALKMIHPETSPGNFGPGIWGGGAYRYLATPFIFLYPLLKFNATAYFAVGLFLYILAGFCVYLLANEITKNKLIATISGIIFASGYVGSYAIFHLSNSYQLTGTAAFMTLTSYFLIKYYQSRRVKFYILSLFLFASTLELFLLRSQGIILIVLAILFLLSKIKLKVTYLVRIFLEALPFVATYYFMYFMDPRVAGVHGGSAGDAFRVTFASIISEGQYEFINNYIITTTNMFVPKPIIDALYRWLTSEVGADLRVIFLALPVISIFLFSIFYLRKRINFKLSLLFSTLSASLYLFNRWSFIRTSPYWNPTILEKFTAALGNFLILIFVFLLLVVFKPLKKYGNIKKSLTLALVWIFSSIAAYFLYSHTTNLLTTSRYAVPTMVGVSIFFASLFYLLVGRLGKIKRVIIIFTLTFLLSITYISLLREEENRIIAQVSIPSRRGYELILKEVPGVDEETVFFIDSEADPTVKGNILGGMGQRGIAVFFKLESGSVRMADSYDELISLISKKEADIENVYTFFATSGGFINTTRDFRNLLSSVSKETLVENWDSITKPPVNEKGEIEVQSVLAKSEQGSFGVNPFFETEVDLPSLTPSQIVLNITATPLGETELTYPFFDLTKNFVGRKIDILDPTWVNLTSLPKISKDKIVQALTLESERRAYLANAKPISATSEWKTLEVRYIKDGKLDTSWQAHNASWNGGVKPQEVVIDLGLEKRISKIYWINHYHFSTPTTYAIYISSDGKNWKTAREVSQGSQRVAGELVEEVITAQYGRFIKFSIEETSRGSGYPPGIDELWVSGLDYQIDAKEKDQIVGCPFCFVENQAAYLDILNLTKVSKAKLSWATDRADSYNPYNFQELPLVYDGTPHAYVISLPAGGTKFTKFKIDNITTPGKIRINSVTFKNLSLSELISKNLIVEYAKEDLRN